MKKVEVKKEESKARKKPTRVSVKRKNEKQSLGRGPKSKGRTADGQSQGAKKKIKRTKISKPKPKSTARTETENAYDKILNEVIEVKLKKNIDIAPVEKITALPRKKIEQMIACERGFTHVFKSGNEVPYILPLNRVLIACHCGQIFDQVGGRKARDHSTYCGKDNDKAAKYKGEMSDLPKITYGSAEFRELRKKPQFLRTGDGRLCLRVHPYNTQVVCICGQVLTCYRHHVGEHTKKCDYYKQCMGDPKSLPVEHN